ncbi:MAG: flagellar biosynthetic protein FliR [Hyphomicrobiales bacterium]|nr:flagellar biosynthetic protein FliR [Hyphomicrobiales bacterium]
MTRFDQFTLVAGFLVFCRIGTCLSFAPGFSSPRIPVRLRLLIAIGLTIALCPPILESFATASRSLTTMQAAPLIARECLIGATIGIMARMVFAALETMFTAASLAIGASSSFAPRVDESESIPEFASLVMFATTALLFVSNAHWEIVRAIYESYAIMPLKSAIAPELALGKIAETLSFGFSIAFRLAAPFLAFGFVSNFAFALVNKIAPQIAIYFVAAPFVLIGGLVLLSITWNDIATQFIASFTDWLWRI